jgi:HSP90 family molecular chaperone
MNWFLLLIILLMGGAGFYEYQTLNGQVTVDQMQITDLKTKLQAASDSEKKSADDVNQLTTGLTDAQAKTSDLEKQLQAANTALAAAQAQIQAAKAAAAPPAAATTAATAFTTKLGTITALDGKTYASCQLLKVNPDSIVISHADGITQVPLNLLPAPTQKMLGFDSTQGKLSDDQVQLLEQKRQMASSSGN